MANNIVVIGAKREGLENINNERNEPFLYSIGHLADEFATRGSFEDIFYSNKEMRDDIVTFLGYEGKHCTKLAKFQKNNCLSKKGGSYVYVVS